MNVRSKSTDAYREQIVACVQSLALGKHESAEDALAEGFAVEHLKMFTDGNLDKRFLKLLDQMELVADGFEEAELEALIVDYVRTVPLFAYDTGCSDSERFLEWVTAARELNVQQRDLICCQLRRFDVETLARENRLAHLRFQELCSLAESLLVNWGTEKGLRLELNPIHAWATLYSRELLDDEADLPATVMFFPVQNEVRTVVLEPIAQAIIRDLHTSGPATVDDLVRNLSRWERSELVDVTRMLVESGLAAIG